MMFLYELPVQRFLVVEKEIVGSTTGCSLCRCRQLLNAVLAEIDY